ncbi:MAG: hypothetical protein WBL63_15230 [Candidatus Acidiferrum sp.]
MKAQWLFTFLFLACGTANCQSLRVLPVQIRGGQGFPAAIQFYCTENYSREDCKNDISILKRTLAHYPVEKLGSWSFILASSGEWEPLVRRLRLSSQSPAFTMLGLHTSVFSQDLYSASLDRRVELRESFGVPLDQLLDFAVAHELGHALCHEHNEDKAVSYGEQLRDGHPPACTLREGPRSTAGSESSILGFVGFAAKLFFRGQPQKAGLVANMNQLLPQDNRTH